jgi:hypothetical protein
VEVDHAPAILTRSPLTLSPDAFAAIMGQVEALAAQLPESYSLLVQSAVAELRIVREKDPQNDQQARGLVAGIIALCQSVGSNGAAGGITQALTRALA